MLLEVMNLTFAWHSESKRRAYALFWLVGMSKEYTFTICSMINCGSDSGNAFSIYKFIKFSTYINFRRSKH